MEKKIGTSVDLLINVARFEHVRVTKYSEQIIEYENEDEMKQKEDQLDKDLISNVVRSLTALPSSIGLNKSRTEAVEAINDTVAKSIPEWMGKPEPNIAKDVHSKAIAEEQAEKVEKTESKEKENEELSNLLDLDDEKSEQAEVAEEVVEEKAEEKIEPQKEEVKEAEVPTSEEDEFISDEELFASDDDLFDEN